MEDLCLKVVSVAEEAGKIIMEIYQQGGVNIEVKSNGTPLTAADIASHKYIVDALQGFSEFPTLSEEGMYESERINSEYVWIVDPIDGTKDFVTRTGEFSVMIGLSHQGSSVLGVVHVPVFNETYYAFKKGGAYLRDAHATKKLHVSGRGIGYMRMVASRNHFKPEMQNLAERLSISKIDRMGSIGIKMGKLAKGDTDVMLYTGAQMGEWDVCAGACIVSEAGGTVSGVRGEELFFNKRNPQMPNGVLVHNGVATELVLAQTASL